MGGGELVVHQLYGIARGHADPRLGDDIFGILHNWGVALYTMAQKANDPATVLTLLDQSAAMLREAGGMKRTDPGVRNALGDALSSRAETLAKQGALPEAMEAYLAARNDGYGGALLIDRMNTDAGIGQAEVHLGVGRLRMEEIFALDTSVQTEAEAAARAEYAAGADVYSRVIAAVTSNRDVRWTFSERSEVLYGYACACAGAGRELQCHEALQDLVSCGGASIVEIAADADFKSVRSKDWFQALRA
ncbi:hypothetical protein CYMTET_17848 [Cymbomonas tetramitiformis]|uniref:Uncharacterized protein n=1 Tax=Cymbomonas tetramitiformis TaxID=36881 RepID=A0AAE0G9Z3_9CHLO|nr:hypothetical protein CYMTET_18163 [Cymbomonas tetramitiformis]KAK3273942.1 hypothetical protein CYMTET_17848 [Cymbomonas tetramitiformis]